MMETERDEGDPWPLRALLLAGLGAVLGLASHQLLFEEAYRFTENPLRLAGASFLVVGGIVFAFTLERERWRWSAAFALACGVVVASVLHWNGAPSDWEAGGGWRLASSLVAVAIAAPLFQTTRDAGHRTLAYRPIHAHAWTNVVLWFAAWAFVLVCFVLTMLLAELFHLIGIDQLRELMRKNWFPAVLIGTALGAGTGLLRDRDKVLFQLQRVVTAVLSILVPLLAIGLVGFVVALPFTGLQPLWDQTSATTPILLGCVAGAVILVNAAIGNGPDEESSALPVRWGAAALAATALPLAVVAVVSTAKRIDQHGYTPERLWALVFVLITAAIGAAYLFCLVRGRKRWSDILRPANVRIAIGICLVALLLATPLIGFGAISTRNQLARLQDGKVPPGEFDWAALRFDFGPSGRAALRQLRASGDSEIQRLAGNALAADSRWTLDSRAQNRRQGRDLANRLRVLPNAAPLPAALRDALAEGGVCRTGPCTLFWQEGAKEAVAVGFGCDSCTAVTTILRPGPKGDWVSQDGPLAPIVISEPSLKDTTAQQRAMREDKVEIREVRRRQVFVDGQPIAEPF